MPQPQLHRGDLVEVRTPAEILATLDDQGDLEGLPFMPEMVAYCGKRYAVERRADKVCDTVKYTGSRKLPDGVLLADLRCSGSGHDGCQAECRLFWKTAWLRQVDGKTPPPPAWPEADAAALVERASRRVKSEVQEEGKPQTIWRCQNTELLHCSEQLGTFDPRPYVNEWTCGNVTLGKFLRVSARAAVQEPLRKLGLVAEIHLPGTAEKGIKYPRLDLKPGEWVRVKSKEEIARTLTPEGRSGGMWFDREMFPYCGGTYRVRQRINRFIHEMNGKMMVLKNELITLDGVVCSGENSLRRWFCPREIFPYWREHWLERVPAPAGAEKPPPAP